MGEGKRRILIVDEQPSETDDEDGTFLSGARGDFLRNVFQLYGIDVLRDCWVTAAITCKGSEKEKPTNDQISWCRPNLINAIDQLQPEVIVSLGMSGLRSVLHSDWSDFGAFAQWVGWRIPLHKTNAWLCPIYEPGHVRKFERDKALQVCFRNQVFAISEISGRPWANPPDFEKQVSVLYDTDEIIEVLSKLSARRKPVAFDYETNMLKPHSDASRLACVSVAPSPNKAYTFPYHGAIRSALISFLSSEVPKIGANLQFENNWTLAHFGVPVRNWVWDVVQMAHVLDNRPDITSVKFQALVRLGQTQYNREIEPFLQSGGGGNSPNRINQADQRQLLHYCGLDSLLEYKIALHQMKEMNVDLINP